MSSSSDQPAPRTLRSWRGHEVMVHIRGMKHNAGGILDEIGDWGVVLRHPSGTRWGAERISHVPDFSSFYPWSSVISIRFVESEEEADMRPAVRLRTLLR